MATLQFWFDFSCPYAYLASTQVEALAQRGGVKLELRPMLLGGVFAARNVPQNLNQTLGEAKARHNAQDMMRYAARFGVPLNMPAGHPIRTVQALRALLVVGPSPALVHALYKAYWVDGVDISTEAGLASVLTAQGHDAAAVLHATKQQEIKDELRRRTDDAIELGIFGAPAFIVDGQLYWGQDRMDQVERALMQQRYAPVDFYFDYSSPFAYLGAMQVEGLLGQAARWRPMLLGAVFKAIGTPMVPLFEQSEAKRVYLAEDMKRQALAANVALRWPSRFPMNSVMALRVTLQAKTQTPEGRELARSIFRAYWAEDQDINDPAVIKTLCEAQGFDGQALIEGTQQPEVKAALKQNTQEAIEAGVFGAPTFVVHTSGGPELFWARIGCRWCSNACHRGERSTRRSPWQRLAIWRTRVVSPVKAECRRSRARSFKRWPSRCRAGRWSMNIT